MTPQDTVIHLRTMRDELAEQISGEVSRNPHRPALGKGKLETAQLRLAALNSALAMIELGTWVAPNEIVIRIKEYPSN